MTFRDKAYSLWVETPNGSTNYFISFNDGQGTFHKLEISELFYLEFRQMERKNRNLQQSDERHREFSEVWDETLNRRARSQPKSLEDKIIEIERSDLLQRTIKELPELQRRRFLLYYEYDYNFYEIGEIEHCTASAVRSSVIIAKEKIKAQMETYLCT